MALPLSETNKEFVKAMSSEGSTASKTNKKSRKSSAAKGRIEEQGLFPVDKIIGERLVNGRVHFKIRWQGYSQEEDSWEPEENLGNVSDLIEEFRESTCGNRVKFGEKRKSSSKSKTIGRYEYVPHSDLVAPKTKYFDDVRDGKIDLTKNDMYSRVKTRKRLHFETEGDFIDCHDSMYCEDDFQLQKCGILNEPFSPSDTAVASSVSTPTTASKYDNHILLDISEIKSEYIQEQVHSPISSISTTGCEAEDIPSSSSSSALHARSSFSEHCTDDPLTVPQSTLDLPDDAPTESVPEKLSSEEEVSVEKCAIDTPLVVETAVSDAPSSCTQSKKIQRVSPNNTQPTEMSDNDEKMDISISAIQPESNIPEKENRLVCRPVVTSEKDLLRIYAKKSSVIEWTPNQLPQLQLESESVSCLTQEELVQAIVFNRWKLFERTVVSGQFLLNNPDQYGYPLIMQTIQRDRISMLRLLLKHGASPNSEEFGSGKTPLMLAAELGHLHAVKALLDYGAFSDKRNNSQETGLSLAIQNGRLSVVELLLNHGTNFYLVHPNHTAINLVTKLKNSRTIDTITLSKIYDLIYQHHNKLTGSMRLTVNQYLTKLNLRNHIVLLPCQWISVMCGRFEIDLNLTAQVELQSPILLLVHGRQCGSNYLFWMEDGPCLVERVLLNGRVQTPLRDSTFVTTLHPMCPSQSSKNRLLLELVQPDSIFDREIRIAIIAIDVRPVHSGNSSTSAAFKTFHTNF